ncbi:MAG: DUF488 domain-containing protein [Rhodospirillales bacterium]|nr:DUF488 domain-containing protein [Rhodospirillales bacterium]
MIATIGYERSSQEDFLATLQASKIEVLVDIRDRAQSRVPGFSKTALSKAARDVGIEYIHHRALGDPKEGREAARAGLIKEFRAIFSRVMKSHDAKEALSKIEALSQSKRICLMCYERDPLNCHRKIVSDHLRNTLGCKIAHLGVIQNGSRRS